MSIPNIFNKDVSDQLIHRIHQLTPNSKPRWGQMEIAQMLAHNNVMFELAFDNKHKKPGILNSFIMKTFVKKIVVGEKPYKRNSRTAPEMKIEGERSFDVEKKRLVDYIQKMQQLGGSSFDKKESHSFGKLSKTEWSNLFYKHLDHHLVQFGQ